MKNKKLQVSESLLSTLINDSTKPKPPKLTHIKDLWEMKNDIDLSPYYQREAVWQPEYKMNLIHSILNVIHLVLKKEFTESDDIQYDHGIAASVSSDPGKIYAMHRKCNRQKSDHTPQTAKQLNNFFDEQVSQ